VNSARTICLLGGYGDVGIRVARLLHEETSSRVVLVGRDEKRAKRAAALVGPRSEGMALDVRGPHAAEHLAEATLCINLTEATPPKLAATLVANGTHFIDTSATPTYVADLRAAIDALPDPRATGVLETGLAPGLTNLLAARLCEDHPDTGSIDILIELGMGAHHGLAATAWTLQALDQTYPMKSQGKWQEVRTGAVSRRFTIQGRSILGVGFAFSDQQSIARDLGLAGARTFLAIDPGWMTNTLHWLSRAPVRRFLGGNSTAIARALQRLPVLGPPGTRVLVEGYNARGEITGKESMSGGPQAELTSHVVAHLALALMHPATDLPPGLQPLGMFVDPASFVERR